MKTMNRKTIVLAALAIVAFTAGLALAQGPGHGRQGKGQGQTCAPGERGPHWERLAEVLELSDEQQARIQELREANQAKNLELRKEMARLRNEFEGEMLKDDVDAGAALKLQQRLGDLRTEMQSNRLETRLAVREQLTPDQRDKMLDMGSRFGHRGGHRGGRHGGHHGHGGHGQHDGRFGRGPGGRGECRFDND